MPAERSSRDALPQLLRGYRNAAADRGIEKQTQALRNPTAPVGDPIDDHVALLLRRVAYRAGTILLLRLRE